MQTDRLAEQKNTRSFFRHNCYNHAIKKKPHIDFQSRYDPNGRLLKIRSNWRHSVNVVVIKYKCCSFQLTYFIILKLNFNKILVLDEVFRVIKITAAKQLMKNSGKQWLRLFLLRNTQRLKRSMGNQPLSLKPIQAPKRIGLVSWRLQHYYETIRRLLQWTCPCPKCPQQLPLWPQTTQLLIIPPRT